MLLYKLKPDILQYTGETVEKVQLLPFVEIRI